MLKIKVCGMRDAENINALCSLPIDYIGFIFYSKSPRYIVDKNIASVVPPTMKKTGVFVNASIEEIQIKKEDFDLEAIQLHGNETPAFCDQIRQMNITTFKAFGIHDSFEWKDIDVYQDVVDYFLFDTKSKAYGGTGEVFNWNKLLENPYDKPYILSGGISTENIKEAANFHDERLYGLDLNSKFEIRPAVKNIELLTQALSIIK